MTAIVSTTEVDRPAAEVFAYATDPTRFSEWQRGVVDGQMDSPRPPAVGAPADEDLAPLPWTQPDGDVIVTSRIRARTARHLGRT